MSPLSDDGSETLPNDALRRLVGDPALFRDLQLWKQKPSAKEAPVLAQRFDDIFGQRTRYKKLGQLLAGLQKRKAELLKVLERPEIPFHTNASENDFRACVTKSAFQNRLRADSFCQISGLCLPRLSLMAFGP